MFKKEKNIFTDLTYDYNIYLESELLNFYINNNPHMINNILYYSEPEFLNVKNIEINVYKKLNKYICEKKINETKNFNTIEPVFIKYPPLLENYYKTKNIIYKKINNIDDILINSNINTYLKIEKSNIINIRLNNLKDDNFNFLKN